MWAGRSLRRSLPLYASGSQRILFAPEVRENLGSRRTEKPNDDLSVEKFQIFCKKYNIPLPQSNYSDRSRFEFDSQWAMSG